MTHEVVTCIPCGYVSVDIGRSTCPVGHVLGTADLTAREIYARRRDAMPTLAEWARRIETAVR